MRLLKLKTLYGGTSRWINRSSSRVSFIVAIMCDTHGMLENSYSLLPCNRSTSCVSYLETWVVKVGIIVAYSPLTLIDYAIV